MGWWKVQDTDDLVGDDAFDILRTAAENVAALYLREFERRPTRSEWQHLLQEALEPSEQLGSTSSESMFAENGRPRAVAITLE